jgi:replication factor C subunit 2/4
LFIDYSGIDVVRNKIKMFAQKKVSLPAGFHKIVILDEADSMTAGAQQALRRTMEIYSNTTRFAFACNVSSKLIEPIQSRCALVRFTKPKDEEVLRRLIQICQMESAPYSPEGLEAILFVADGDVRCAINSLQSTFVGFSFINPEFVYRVCDQPSPSTAASILDSCLAGIRLFYRRKLRGVAPIALHAVAPGVLLLGPHLHLFQGSQVSQDRRASAAAFYEACWHHSHEDC